MSVNVLVSTLGRIASLVVIVALLNTASKETRIDKTIASNQSKVFVQESYFHKLNETETH